MEPQEFDLSGAATEAIHPQSRHLDTFSVREIVALMNREDARVVEAVREQLDQVACLVEAVVASLERGGRLFYVGAGTSGRLGVLDASECPPTFGTSPERVQGILAGGLEAFGRAAEAAEDDPWRGAEELRRRHLTGEDFVVGISASGRTPFVLGAVDYARQQGAGTGAVTCNPGCPLARQVEHPVVVSVGPEILAGSTRLKAGTATKMVLNMISTAAMVRLGRCLGNLMVQLRPASGKLRERTVRILAEAGGLSQEEARRMLRRAGGDLPAGIVMAAGAPTLEEARRLLAEAGGVAEAVRRLRRGS